MNYHHLSVQYYDPPTCIIILSSMRSGSVGIAGHLGPIPPAAAKTPRDHLQLELGTRPTTPTIRPQSASHSSLIALHASDCCWQVVAAKPLPNCPTLSPFLPSSDRYLLPLRNSHFQLQTRLQLCLGLLACNAILGGGQLLLRR